jgi:uncharacterized membrane protein
MIKNKQYLSIGILVLFHLIGIGGVMLGDSQEFLSLTPLNLLLTLLIILINHHYWKNWWIFLLSYLAGLGIEIIGVNTGWPFGEYVYGPVLGPKIFSTPLMIGVNWLMLLYATNAIAKSLSGHWILRAAIAGALMTFLDLLIEPVAIKLDFWTWSADSVPLANYFSWFVIATLLSAVWQRLQIDMNRKIAVAVFGVQMGFFLILNFA